MRWRAVPIADHLVNRFLRDLGNYSMCVAVLTVAGEQQEFLTQGSRKSKHARSLRVIWLWPKREM